jgi:Uma2 family endonuclease
MTAAATSSQHYTPEDLLRMPDAHRYELTEDGELKERNMSLYSGLVEAELSGRVREHAHERHLGLVGGSSSGLQIFEWAPHKLVFPDGCFFSRERLAGPVPLEGWSAVAPDLVFEVVSPNDLARDVQAKVRDYLRAGVRLVWVLYPETKSVVAFRPDRTAVTIPEDGDLSGEDVLPGFTCRVGELFPEQAPAVASES